MTAVVDDFNVYGSCSGVMGVSLLEQVASTIRQQSSIHSFTCLISYFNCLTGNVK